MTLYYIIAALVFACSAAVTFKTKTVTYKQFLIGLALFPVAFFVSGQPIDNLSYHLGAATIIYMLGLWIRFMDREFGGGVIHAFTLAALWIPTFSIFYDYLSTALILGGVLTVIIFCVHRSKSVMIRDYAAMALATACGYFLFQVHQGVANPETAEAIQAEAQLDEEVVKPGLR